MAALKCNCCSIVGEECIGGTDTKCCDECALGDGEGKPDQCSLIYAFLRSNARKDCLEHPICKNHNLSDLQVVAALENDPSKKDSVQEFKKLYYKFNSIRLENNAQQEELKQTEAEAEAEAEAALNSVT